MSIYISWQKLQYPTLIGVFVFDGQYEMGSETAAKLTQRNVRNYSLFVSPGTMEICRQLSSIPDSGHTGECIEQMCAIIDNEYRRKRHGPGPANLVCKSYGGAPPTRWDVEPTLYIWKKIGIDTLRYRVESSPKSWWRWVTITLPSENLPVNSHLPTESGWLFTPSPKKLPWTDKTGVVLASAMTPTHLVEERGVYSTNRDREQAPVDREETVNFEIRTTVLVKDAPIEEVRRAMSSQIDSSSVAPEIPKLNIIAPNIDEHHLNVIERWANKEQTDEDVDNDTFVSSFSKLRQSLIPFLKLVVTD